MQFRTCGECRLSAMDSKMGLAASSVMTAATCWAYTCQMGCKDKPMKKFKHGEPNFLENQSTVRAGQEGPIACKSGLIWLDKSFDAVSFLHCFSHCHMTIFAAQQVR